MEKETGFSLSNLINKYWLMLTVLIGLVFLVYFNSLNGGLISDDKGLTDPRNYSSFGKIFADPFAALRLTFYAVVHPLCGDVGACYRLPSIFAHAGNAVLVFFLVSLLMKRRIAFFASILFTVHPILTEGVSWISAGAYPIYTFFFLASLICYVLSERIDSRYLTKTLTKNNLYTGSIILMVIALFTTNRVMALPIFFLYELVFGDLKRNWKKLLPFAFLGVLWISIQIFQVKPRVAEVESQGGGGANIYSPFFLWPFAIGNYLKLFVWPMALSFYHTDYEKPIAEMVLRWGVLVSCLSFLIYSFFKQKKLFFWAAFFFLGMLLYLLPLQLAWLVAERYVYLASIGLFVLTGAFLDKLCRLKGGRIPVLIAFWIIVSLLGLRTTIRNFDWRSEDTLLTAVLKTNPENAKAHNHVGTIYGRNKDYVNAIKEFDQAIALDKGLAEAYHNKGNAYYEQGQHDLAIPMFEKAISVNPKHWNSYQSLAVIFMEQKDFAKAIPFTKFAIQYNPNPNPQQFINLGGEYLAIGEKQSALDAFNQALVLDPGNPTAQAGLAQAYQLPDKKETK